MVFASEILHEKTQNQVSKFNFDHKIFKAKKIEGEKKFKTF